VQLRETNGVVPWLYDPASSALMESLLPKPLPTPPPHLGAPPCTTRQLALTHYEPLGIMQDDAISISFRNVSASACLLRGTPRVVAGSPDALNVNAKPERLPLIDEVTDTAPGATVDVQVDVPDLCSTDPGGSTAGLATYDTLRVSLGGVNRAIKGLHLALPCGLWTTPFFSPKPQPTYPADPLARLTLQLRSPATVRAGTTLHYVVVLSNPTDHTIALSPCPVYLEFSPSVGVKLPYRLNCDQVQSIAAHAHVRYQMEMAIPRHASPGMTQLFWDLTGVVGVDTHGVVRVIDRVHDTGRG
jgi:hypothetical protein